MEFEKFLQLIPKIKNIVLPGQVSHFKMLPEFRQEALKKDKYAIKHAKHAAVLALFYPCENRETKFVLILRNSYRGVHSAQVSFPGGKPEDQDKSMRDTALREAFEEIGVPQKSVKIIKNLSQVYIPPSNFYVHPFMGVMESIPTFKKQDREVEEVIEVGLKHLLDNQLLVLSKVKASYSVEVKVPAFKFNNHIVWGATAMMLNEIKDVLKELV